ncbi:hypothetical protein CC1G_00225 [Coprinopsis cinerea okayama7|uniref:Zn(2)-C6 fungal-type domain-containing protein n=1 Tax=Coprinopsis cinerea (strain Okayama-7 / 130 / ATCC MYA-4618 / FGSC 9003) TaxID=240176 RepID=A8NX77_COPC7|nr:hypothetical protein CC1G_00225 [Coprinopsis cinerea okayama7\|eukprot:XP_001837089.2 hypothetical protein CC1G_00225 [Coprinopsis cinerea okayama7\
MELNPQELEPRTLYRPIPAPIHSHTPDEMTSHSSRKRTDMACQNCRKRKIKCESNKPDPCEHCKKTNKRECNYIPVAEDTAMNGSRTSPPSSHTFLHIHSSPSSSSSRSSPPAHSPHRSRSYSNDNAYTSSPEMSRAAYVLASSSPIEELPFDGNYQGYPQTSQSYATTTYTPVPQTYPAYPAAVNHSMPQSSFSTSPPAELATGLASPLSDFSNVNPSQVWPSEIQTPYSASGISSPSYAHEQMYYPGANQPPSSGYHQNGHYQQPQSHYYAAETNQYYQSTQYSDLRPGY